MAQDKNKADKKTFGETMRDIGKNIARDVSMGVSGGFGSFEKQAKNLEKAGYSSAEIKDFQDRTKATMERNRLEAADRGSDRDRPEKKPEPPPPAPPEPPPPAPPVVETPKPPPPPAPVRPSDTTSTGPSEDRALESAKQGLASTILTSGQGVVEEEPGLLRTRRSLVGRGLIQ